MLSHIIWFFFTDWSFALRIQQIFQPFLFKFQRSIAAVVFWTSIKCTCFMWAFEFSGSVRVGWLKLWEERAQFIAQTDGYGTQDDSSKSSSQSNSYMPEQTPKVTVWCIRHVRVMGLLLPVVTTKEMNGKKSQMAMTSGPRPLSIQ